jgi:hypothetical protein
MNMGQQDEIQTGNSQRFQPGDQMVDRGRRPRVHDEDKIVGDGHPATDEPPLTGQILIQIDQV